MYTILRRIFQDDIAKIIYDFNINNYVNERIIPSLFVLDNMIMNLLNIYKYAQPERMNKYFDGDYVSYSIRTNLNQFTYIYNRLIYAFKYFINKGYYTLDKNLMNDIVLFNKTVKNLIAYSYDTSSLVLDRLQQKTIELELLI